MYEAFRYAKLFTLGEQPFVSGGRKVYRIERRDEQNIEFIHEERLIDASYYHFCGRCIKVSWGQILAIDNETLALTYIDSYDKNSDLCGVYGGVVTFLHEEN